MAPIFDSVQQLVNENSSDLFLQASEILLKFANNILKHPNDSKYRRIRLGNPTIESKLLPVSGAMECLFDMGFGESEDGSCLILPMGSNIGALTDIKNQLDNERAVMLRTQPQVQQPPSVARTTGAVARTTGAAQSTATVMSQTAQSPSSSSGIPVERPSMDMLVKEQAFHRKLEAQLNHVLIYEDQKVQQKARDVIPIVQLTEEAKQMLESLKQAGSSDQDVQTAPYDERDCLVLALLKWFKHSFFRWMDAPKCRVCGANTRGTGSGQPTEEELRWAGNRVENYSCPSCQAITRFVRYNHPQKLLETREGRCGEWANCFTLCCRALNFEARYVLDWTDHVWTEVFSNSQQRWVHCDPCENSCDKPLIYEVGWGKKLTYIIAFSKDDIEDVTWRYSADFAGVLQRRTECRENWLVNTIYNLDKNKWSTMSEAKRNTRLKRKITDLVEFMIQKSADGQNLSGRTTGSLEWRLSRGEMGDQTQARSKPYTFTLTEEEKTGKSFHLKYSCSRDEYVRISHQGEVTSGYLARLHSCENVFRKEESDWRMVYLARTEGSSAAEIVWKFDFKESGLTIDKLEVKLDCAKYENGRINIMVCSDETCAMLKGGPTVETLTSLVGETGFSITASLSGGKGDVAWQHTQLFRQSSDDVASYPLEIKVTFK